MARPLRIEFEDALYHVTSRGDGQQAIFRDNVDRRHFYDVLGQVCKRHHWLVHAECQMTNHYHLLIETPEGNLSRGMQQLNGVYAQRFNRRHQRVGHVLQGRYKAIIVQHDTYLLELARYIVLNPVRAQRVRAAEGWTWSSYRATAGLAHRPDWLYTDRLLSAFGKRARVAAARYQAFVAAGVNQPSPWKDVRNQIYLGSESFVHEMQVTKAPDRELDEVPTIQRRPVRKPLSYYEHTYRHRDRAIVEAYASGNYTLKELGAHFGLHYSRVSRIVRDLSEFGPPN